MIKVITSKSNPRVKYAFELKAKKNQKEYHEFIGESFKSLEMAIKAHLVKEVFTYKELDIDESITQYIVNEEIMKKLSSSVNPEGVVFIASMPSINKKDFQKILYLDEINDPGNLGTMVRTALAFNFDAVIYSSGSVSIYNDKALASAKGANYIIPVFEDDLSKYKDKYTIIVSTLSNDSVSLETCPVKNKFVLVMGNEAHGVTEKTLALADIKVKIPIHNIDSLNVSVCSGILMHYFSNK